MNALNWIKERAAKETDAPIEVEGTSYAVERMFFVGRLPSRMISQLYKCEVENNDFRVETINVNTRNNRVEYCLTTYTAQT